MALLGSRKTVEKVDLSTIEIGQAGTSMWTALGGKTYNPDSIGINTYKKMMEDTQIQVAFNLIKYATLSRDWRIIGDKSAAKQIEFLYYNFENIENKIDGALADILYAIPYGFSTTEIVWEYIEGKKYKGKIGLKKLKSLDPETIEFKVDDLGNLLEIIQKQEGPKSREVSVPIEKTILYVENPQFGNLYGTSRLKAVYKNWFIKDTLTKFWNIYLERFGMPLAIGTVPSVTFMDKMQKILDNIQSKSSIVKTAGWELEFLEAKKGGGTVSEYKLAIDYHNEQILKGMLVPSLMVEVSGSGSYALGKTHFDIFSLMIKNLERDLIAIVDSRIIKPLIDFNFGELDEYPSFRLDPLTKDDLLNLSKVFALLTKNGIVGIDETFMRDMMNIPHRDDTTLDPSGAAATAKINASIEPPSPFGNKPSQQVNNGGK